jgi:hypothetical protein
MAEAQPEQEAAARAAAEARTRRLADALRRGEEQLNAMCAEVERLRALLDRQHE